MKFENVFCFCLDLISKLAIDIACHAEANQMQTSYGVKAQTLVSESNALKFSNQHHSSVGFW